MDPEGDLVGGRRVTRRQFLTASAAAALLVACTDSDTDDLLDRATSTPPRGRGLEAIEHVVIVMQENRSFDHYFGVYPGVRGFDDRFDGGLGPFVQRYEGREVLPFHLDVASSMPMCAGNDSVPIHDWGPAHEAWANGRMDRYLAVHSRDDGEAQGPLCMGYFTRSDLPFYYALADGFTICDAYHCSVMGPTAPNRLYGLSATIDPSGVAGGPVVATPGDADASRAAIGSARWATMFDRLDDDGVSWKCYQEPGTADGPNRDVSLADTFNAFPFFEQFQDPTTRLYRRAFLPSWPDEFAADVESGKLPQVSWMTPPLLASEHASAAPTNGERYVKRILSILVSNPEVWAKTVLIVTYDEDGGFFDHVAPPTPEPGTEGEELTVSSLPPAAGEVSGPIGLGFRVPALVVSPFSRGGHVNSDVFDHTSLLRLLEARFGTRVPNLTDWRRRTVGDLTSTLQLDEHDASVPRLPSLREAKAKLDAECPDNESLVVLVQTPPPLTVPSDQEMPSQERP